MGEDACAIYRDNAPEILSSIRHLALNLLRAEKTKKVSLRRKQELAKMDTSYLEKIITAA